MKAAVSITSDYETIHNGVKGFVIPKDSKLATASSAWGFSTIPFDDNSVLIQFDEIEMDVDLSDILKMSDEFDKIAQVFHNYKGDLTVLFEYSYCRV